MKRRLLAGWAWIGLATACGVQGASRDDAISGGGGAMPSGGSMSGGSMSGGSMSGGSMSGGSMSGGSMSGGSMSGGSMSGGLGSVAGGVSSATGGQNEPGGWTSTGGGASASGGSTQEVLAFPGAEGFGRHATGARYGEVAHVTNLSDSGPGSLRDAISQPNRTVVFEVAGVIHLESRLVFLEKQTIAGQTSPGGGIVVYGDGTSFTNAHNTIVRFVRFRMGLIGESGKDTITIARGHDMIFDHCSISWGRDGNFDLNQESGYELANITLQDSIVSQGLQTHSTGGLLNARGVSVLRSLYVDNNSRNPKARMTTQWVNNVVYNWVDSGYILGDTSGRSDGYIVGSYFITGPETNGGTLDSPTDAYHVFALGNYYDSDRNGLLNGRALGQGDFGSVTWESTPSADFPEVSEMGASEAFEHVLENAGASRFRDPVDEYVVAEVRSLGTRGATISDEKSLGLAQVVGNIPTAPSPPDEDRDGMADSWEISNQLSPEDPSDRNGDRDGDGYTNLEEYINSLTAVAQP
jgi:pectate lyase